MDTYLPIANLKHLTLPGPAGDMQRRSEWPSLVRELGGDYETYHDFLSGELEAYGHVPERAEFDSSEEFYDTWARIHEIVLTEVFLRACVLHRRYGMSLTTPPLHQVIGDDHRLVAMPPLNPLIPPVNHYAMPKEQTPPPPAPSG